MANISIWILFVQMVLINTCRGLITNDTINKESNDSINTNIVNTNAITYFYNTEHMNISFVFSPGTTKDLMWKDEVEMSILFSCYDSILNLGNSAQFVRIVSTDIEVIQVVSNSDFMINCSKANIMQNESTERQLTSTSTTSDEIATNVVGYNHTFTLRGVFLGYASIDLFIFNNKADFYNFVRSSNNYEHDNSSRYELYIPNAYKLIVLNKETILNRIFILVVAIVVLVLNFGFGCRINVEKVKEILRRPFAPLLGIFCQFVLMPLLGIGISKLLFMSPMLAFGLFVVSCSPGGNGSNVWTYILGGDLDLSMTMTLFSKTFALATMPAWLFAVSRLYISEDTQIKIPYLNLGVGLISIAIPIFLGVLLNRFKPHIAKKVTKALKPVSLVFVLWVLIVGSITNTFIYTIMYKIWYVIPAACMLGYSGMLTGFAASKITRQPDERITAISIETGIQDTGIGILLLLTSFEKPLSSIATTMPIACAMFTPLPLVIITTIMMLYNNCWRRGRCVKCGGPEPPEKPVPTDDDYFDTVIKGNKNNDLQAREERDRNKSDNQNFDLNCNNEDVEQLPTFNRNQQRLASKHYKTKL